VVNGKVVKLAIAGKILYYNSNQVKLIVTSMSSIGDIRTNIKPGEDIGVSPDYFTNIEKMEKGSKVVLLFSDTDLYPGSVIEYRVIKDKKHLFKPFQK
jgi:hypothetical protein